MEKNSKKSGKIVLHPIAVRALSDLHYAYFCVGSATRYLDSSHEDLKKCRAELDEALNNFFMTINSLEDGKANSEVS